MRPRKRLIACVAALLLATCGCVDLHEITQFAKVSQDVGTAYPVFADEAAASCNRADSFITGKNQVTPLPCEIYPALKPSLVKVNAALFDYIASLGKLASVDLSDAPGGWRHGSSSARFAETSVTMLVNALLPFPRTSEYATYGHWYSGALLVVEEETQHNT